MSSPSINGIPVGNYIPCIIHVLNRFETNILFKDEWYDKYRLLGIERQDMPIIMNMAMRVDPLCGLEDLKYIDEE